MDSRRAAARRRPRTRRRARTIRRPRKNTARMPEAAVARPRRSRQPVRVDLRAGPGAWKPPAIPHSTPRPAPIAPVRKRAPSINCGGATSAGSDRLNLNGRTPAAGVQTPMRLVALLVTAIVTAAPVHAQQTPPSTPANATSPAKDTGAADDQTSKLPVSLDKIRQALEQPPAEPLRGLDERPLFRVEIRERQRIEDLLQSLKFDSGPAIPGGLYGYEQQRIMFPSVDNPLAQPWSAFSQPELARVAAYSIIETLISK